MKKIAWGLALFFYCTSAFLFYKFVYYIEDIPSIRVNNRILIELSKNERTFILMEMNSFLSDIKLISNGIVEEDYDQIVATSTIGSEIIERVSPALMRKLPLAFNKAGFAMQNEFRGITRLAKEEASFDEILNKYNLLLRKCVECHVKYKLLEPF